MVNFFYVPSLKSIVINRICIAVCYKTNFFSVVDSCKDNLHLYSRNLADWRKKSAFYFSCGVSELEIPRHLRGEILERLLDVAFANYSWMYENYETVMYKFLIDHFDLVKWDSFGNIDGRQTVLNIKQHYSEKVNGQVPTWKIFCIACYYSYEDIIAELLPKMATLPPGDAQIEMAKCPLTTYWLSQPECRGNSNYELFKYAVSHLSIPSVQYFMRKMSEEEMDKLFRAFKSAFDEELFGYLYTQKRITYCMGSDMFACFMSSFSRQQLRELFKASSARILNYILTSAHRENFFTILDEFSEYITLNSLYCVLVLTARLKDGLPFSYSEIFMTLFKKRSGREKKKIIEKALEPRYLLLRSLSKQKKKRCIDLLLCFASTFQGLKIKMIVRRTLNGGRSSHFRKTND